MIFFAVFLPGFFIVSDMYTSTGSEVANKIDTLPLGFIWKLVGNVKYYSEPDYGK